MTSSQHRLAQALFAPRSVALIGASGDAGKNTSRPQRFLRKHGYTGTVFPINPGRQEIFGEKAYPDLRAVPAPVDHAFIMVPAPSVAAAIAQCCEKRVPVVTIFSDGFAETGAAGRRQQDELLKLARASGVRLLGPNCIGLLDMHSHLVLSVNAVLEDAQVRAGATAIVSQSGSMMGSLMSRGLGRGTGFSKLVSVGNESDLAVGEITDLLVDDADTRVILLFMETIRDADRLARAARRAHDAGKPVIVFKLGRSEVGVELASSHTGAMTGADDVADAFFRAHGMLRVDLLETLFELPALILGRRPAARHRVAAMTTTGGGAATVVDRLGTLGVEVVPPTEDIVARLAQKKIGITRARLTDLTLAGAKKEIYSAVLSELLASDHCDLVLAVVGSSAQFQPHIAIDPIVEARRGEKPLAVFCAPQADASLALLAEAGIAGFRTPEACADAIRAWRDWRAPLPAPAADAARIGAARAGRDAGTIEVVARLQTAVTDDVAGARGMLRQMFGPYLATSVYNPFLAWCGYPEAAKAIDTAWRAKDRAANLAAVSDEMIDRIAIVGSAEHCRARVAAFEAAGVTTPMIHPFLFDEAAIWRTLEGLAPARG